MPNGSGDIDDAGEIGFEEVHHAERAEKGADADAMAGAEQAGKHGEIDQRVGDKQQRVDGGVGGELGGQGGRELGHSGRTPASALEMPKANAPVRSYQAMVNGAETRRLFGSMTAALRAALDWPAHCQPRRDPAWSCRLLVDER